MEKMRNIIEDINSKSLLEEIYNRFISKPIIIVTLPLNAELYYFFLKENNINIVGGCDSNFEKNNQKFHNISFKSIEETVEKYGSNVNYFILCREKYWLEIVQHLIDVGINTDQCFTNEIIFNPFFKNSYSTLEQLHISKFKNEIQDVYFLLQDDFSKEIYIKILRHRFFNNSYQVLNNLAVYPQYFQTDLLNFTDEEVYVDAGVLDGETINEFVCMTKGKYKKIYGLEINPDSSGLCKEKFKEEPRIEIIQKGLFDEDSMARADWRNTYNSTLVLGGDELVEVIKGDSLNIKPTFIKMDIEGAELRALKGFQNTIKMYRPKLAICIYHKIEDLWVIPLYVKKLVPEYKFFIRHHSTFGNLYETVLYATV